MPSPQEREAALFALALEKPVAERAAILQVFCGEDSALRLRLEALLAAHEAPTGVLSNEPAREVLSSTIDQPEPVPDEAVGMTLGRYKLREKLGEGGCGTVYVAEQTEPVRRRVALKVIKLGMDTREVIARFEAERQALAMMDHPNIAKVLDAGTTDAGRPFFVMELVRGIRITDYCDQANLSTKERLDLFIKVCQAIQHAHQKGIIHRDIKPGNILVTLHDGVPVPKVIDFGIAKATEGRLVDATVYTQLHQFMGTPAYMSPEQAEMSGLDVDTRSDIYSLGVLLYQLLTSKTPFDGKELLSMGLDAMRKTIREKEPIRPSTRLATLGADQLTTTARRRSADTSKLLHQLRGDLDWIVMKCLEKDRTRRYETANGLAMDLKRHLGNEPVLARPPSTAYRLQKLVRRNKLAVAATAAVATALLVAAGMGAVAWRSQVAKQGLLEVQRHAAMEKAFMAVRTGDFEEANRAIAEAELGGASLADVHLLRGNLALARQDYVEAKRELEHTIKLQPRRLAAHALMATVTSIHRMDPMEFEIRYEAAARLTPVTPEDFLFRGIMEQYFDPVQALKHLDEAVRLRPSGVARLNRAQVRNWVASLTGSITDVELALEDARTAGELFPEHPDALAAELNACITAVGIYRDAGLQAKAETIRARAAVAAQSMKRHNRYPTVVQTLVQYLDFTLEDRNAALEELDRARARSAEPAFDLSYGFVLFAGGESAGALQVFQKHTAVLNLRPDAGFIFLDLTDGPSQAMQQHRQFMATNPPSVMSLYSLGIPLAVGNKAEATAGFRQVREQLQGQRSLALLARGDWYLKLLDFGCDRLSVDELVNAMGASLWNRCEGHYLIGLRRLGEGHRAAARAHFEKCVATRVYGFIDYYWSRAFLTRMDKDPNWPPWLATREGATTP